MSFLLANAALLPLLLAIAAFLAYSWAEVLRSGKTTVPRWIWLAVILLTLPVGWLVFRTVERAALRLQVPRSRLRWYQRMRYLFPVLAVTLLLAVFAPVITGVVTRPPTTPAHAPSSPALPSR